jgi:carbonic anhydrase
VIDTQLPYRHGGDLMVEPFDALMEGNRAYVESGAHRSLPVRPSRHLAIVTCMDCRLDTFASLGLELGEAHIIRTAGARITQDVLRSLTLSAHALGTRSVAVIAHTDCGVKDPEGTLVDRLTTAIGRPPIERIWHAFVDPEATVREDCALLCRWQDRPNELTVAGYLLDVETGALSEVVPPRTVPDAPR